MENDLQTGLTILAIVAAIAACVLVGRGLLARMGDYWKWLS